MRFFVFLALCLLSTVAFANPHKNLCKTKFEITYEGITFTGRATVVNYLSIGTLAELDMDVCKLMEENNEKIDFSPHAIDHLLINARLPNGQRVERLLTCTGTVRPEHVNLSCIDERE